MVWKPIPRACALVLSAGLQGAEAASESRTQADESATLALTAPVAISDLHVAYPDGAQGDANVELELLIDAEGRVSEATVTSQASPFDDLARAAASRWLFRPALRNGIAVAARIRVIVEFREPAKEAPEASGQDASSSGQNMAPSAERAEAPPSTDAPREPQTSMASPLSELPPIVEVTVEGERAHSPRTLSRAEVRQLPGAFGDPFRAVDALPGITPIASGVPYFFVRGAPPGNVGYFFDGIALPALYHVAAGPGVIHPAFVESVDLYAGAYPARYGRYTGGIIAAEGAQPQHEARGEVSLRLVDSGGFVELPFAEGQGNLMLAGRYSYTGLLVSLLVPEVSVGYWDYQGRASYALSDTRTLSVFGFGAFDFLEAENPAGERQRVYDATFHRVDVRYDERVSDVTAMRLATTIGYDRTGAGADVGGDLLRRSATARFELSHHASHAVELRTGADVEWSRLNIDIDAINDTDEDDEPPSEPVEDRVSPEPGFPTSVLEPLFDARFQDRQAALSDRFSTRSDVLAGAHADVVLNVATGVTLTPGLRFDAYRTGVSSAFALEPRIAARYRVGDGTSLLHDFGLSHQPPGFVVPAPGLYGDVDEGLQTALQSSAGIEQELPARFSGSVTLFQNVLLDATDSIGTFNLQRSDFSLDSAVDRSLGHSYGVELYLKRPLSERLGGFLSYTWSHSTRAIGRLAGPSSVDRRHVLNLAASYDFGHRFRLGGRLAAYSGIPSEVAYAEAARNPPRTPWYFRLDWRLEKQFPIGTSGASWSLVAEVLNTTFAKETLERSCYAYGCAAEQIGPVTIPSLGVEASF